jgi:uncharacterized membrane protein HdeD (DUF308 family)
MNEMRMPLFEGLARNWSWIMIRGIAAILFGILAIAMPGLSLAVLIMLFGAYALVDGVFNLVAAFRHRGEMWAFLLESFVSIAFGVIALLLPGLTAVALVYLIAGWALFTGILEIAAAIRLRKVIQGEVWLILAGLLSIAFGALIAMYPGAGALALILYIGVYAIVFGGVLVALSLRLRKRAMELGHGAPAPRIAPA